jgi:2-amino-4-hydroxy-6-hydroxymethyldihydropteridine diphosphokinase
MGFVYLALGSNLGDRREHLRSGIRGLAARGIEIMQTAATYSTEPRDVLDQPWFLNTAIKISTVLAPCPLLQLCLDVEKESGRLRDRNKGPRTLDIDIIFYGADIISEPGLTIPHPSFSTRRFVLEPLAEIAADVIDPRTGKTVKQLLDACTDQSRVIRQDS